MVKCESIELSMLGKCEIRYGDKVIKELRGIEWVLLQFLYVNRSRFVSAEEIAQALWSMKEIADYRNSVRVMVCRVRKKLDQLEPGLGEKVLLRMKNAYCLNTSIPMNGDVDQLQVLLDEAESVEDDTAQKHKIQAKIADLYNRGILCNCKSSYWQRVLRDYYDGLVEKVLGDKAVNMQTALTQ